MYVILWWDQNLSVAESPFLAFLVIYIITYFCYSPLSQVREQFFESSWINAHDASFRWRPLGSNCKWHFVNWVYQCTWFIIWMEACGRNEKLNQTYRGVTQGGGPGSRGVNENCVAGVFLPMLGSYLVRRIRTTWNLKNQLPYLTRGSIKKNLILEPEPEVLSNFQKKSWNWDQKFSWKLKTWPTLVRNTNLVTRSS